MHLQCIQTCGRDNIREWKSPVEENHFDINILSVLVQEVLQEVGHRLIGDVATDHDVPGKNTKSLKKSDLCNVVDCHAPYMTYMQSADIENERKNLAHCESFQD